MFQINQLLILTRELIQDAMYIFDFGVNNKLKLVASPVLYRDILLFYINIIYHNNCYKI